PGCQALSTTSRTEVCRLHSCSESGTNAAGCFRSMEFPLLFWLQSYSRIGGVASRIWPGTDKSIYGAIYGNQANSRHSKHAESFQQRLGAKVLEHPENHG